MRRVVDLPFGAMPEPGGETRFRLWAPDAGGAEVLLDGAAPRALAMERADGGWFELRTSAAPAGTRYKYRVDGGIAFPDPASRSQPEGVHGPSAVVDPTAFEWSDGDWRGRPWPETVISEIHVGTFSPEGTFLGAIDRLDSLVDAGITAIELMPIAEFPGRRDWGYDGVHLFAPASAYGAPDDLKRLVVEAHRRGLMVLLDVVYNHFGPEGNYLGLHAPDFFTERHETPWGAAIDFESGQAAPARAFMAMNAAYWVGEYGLDGLRLDAVHAIFDRTDVETPHVLEEIARAARRAGEGRHVHLVLENDDNAAWPLDPTEADAGRYDAQWNDDFHHAAHVIATGEVSGYYADYANRPVAHLARTLAEGFAYQGEPSEHRDGRLRGERSNHLPPTAFVDFLQNHDQIGNRALGERLESLAPPEAVEALLAILLLAPSVPLLFMGEEWGAREPFPFFCDFGPELSDAVREGRRREFAGFPEFVRHDLPDPLAPETMERARLDWSARERPPHLARIGLVRDLLALRRAHIVPLLVGAGGNSGSFDLVGPAALDVRWTFAAGRLRLRANLGAAAGPETVSPEGDTVFATPGAVDGDVMPPWSVAWFLARTGDAS
jgi:malto-oligosyltrehalose trehalohydrolase